MSLASAVGLCPRPHAESFGLSDLSHGATLFELPNGKETVPALVASRPRTVALFYDSHLNQDKLPAGNDGPFAVMLRHLREELPAPPAVVVLLKGDEAERARSERPLRGDYRGGQLDVRLWVDGTVEQNLRSNGILWPLQPIQDAAQQEPTAQATLGRPKTWVIIALCLAVIYSAGVTLSTIASSAKTVSLPSPLSSPERFEDCQAGPSKTGRALGEILKELQEPHFVEVDHSRCTSLVCRLNWLLGAPRAGTGTKATTVSPLTRNQLQTLEEAPRKLEELNARICSLQRQVQAQAQRAVDIRGKCTQWISEAKDRAESSPVYSLLNALGLA
eukprot:m51a1_g3911 hypothetical protein (332) ;mRNA; r:136193-137409